MRVARLLPVLLTVVLIGLLGAPAASAKPPFRIPDYITDETGTLSAAQRSEVEDAVNRLYDQKRVRLWVVFVDEFGQSALSWAQSTMRLSDFGDRDALLAVAVTERAYAFQVPTAVMSQSAAESLQVDRIEPALRADDFAGAAVAAADGIAGQTASRTTAPSGSPAGTPGTSGKSKGSPVTMIVILGVLAVGVVLMVLWSRRRRGKRRAADLEAARKLDPADPQALASVPIDALDDLSRLIVVDVDNAVRTSESELTLAEDEFGTSQTEPFRRAVGNARTTLAQAFNVRQTLDDSVPETPQQRRDLLTRVIVAAAKADHELDAQSEAFEKLRDLVINAPDRLDALTQQMIDLMARIGPAEQTMATLHSQFDATALTSVEDNVATAKERLKFAEQSISTARGLVARPAGQQMGLVDAIRAAESSLGQARGLLEAIDSAGSDINRAVATLPSAITDIQNGIDEAAKQLQREPTSYRAQLTSAHAAAVAALADAKAQGNTDPLGVFTRLTQADARLDQLLASADEERSAKERLSRAYDQALFTAQSRVRGVSDFIDTRRGSIGPEARTRLAEAVRQLQAAQDKKMTNLGEAIAHANGASTLASQAQSLANDDVRAAQRSYTSGGGWGGGSSGGDLGAVIGGIIIGNVLGGGRRRGGFGGGIGGGFGGGFGGGRSSGRSSSYGGASRSSGRSYSGGGGRF
ncbi:TPM domain-containing protein [Mycobacterium sp. Y57]|uniref:TPM domain-containing protein n=1 Tax=Mycolicibacterium xanthum TaxID=2796469 RepID=UPI001C85D69A|nr:TPM domain-containing protein [Mycolicibacterium xanthum]MBX7431521.1 TPM domain-containing protein [Mycolicibacterium xanthum]